MRVSLAWIEHLLAVERLPLSDGALLERLVLQLAEIEELEAVGPDLDPLVVVGRVLTCTAHPGADRLRCTTVDVGADAPLPVVCGAPNVAAGQTVAVALPGARVRVPARDGDGLQEITIKKGKLRGEPSEGMICAEDELGLGTGHDGILVLDTTAAPGTAVARILPGADRVLVIDNHNINHRPDLWGHLGWAREIAALCDLPAPAAPGLATDLPVTPAMSVEVDDPRCSAYRGAVLSGLDNGPSPAWMQRFLQAAGVRPLGLLVDVTNYVMLELGEPMHAFDRRRIRGDRIVVRAATEGEELTTLDGRTHRLLTSDLVIADGGGLLALAGIMGGEASGVADDTDTIVLEAATFPAAAIRRTRVRTGLATDSSSRFEKGLYPELAQAGLLRAIALLRACRPDCRVEGLFGTLPADGAGHRLPFDPGRVRALTGLDIDDQRQAVLLARLGIARNGDTVRVPWWRTKDLAEGIDLVEEVARLHGWQQVAAEVPRLPAAAPSANPLRRAEHRCRDLLAAAGWDEVATYGFTSEAWATALAWPADGCIRLSHPLSQEMTVLRRSLLPNLAEALTRNRRFLDTVRCYEIGKVYGTAMGRDDTACERLQVAGIHAASDQSTPFYTARHAALAVLGGLGHRAELRVHGGDVDAQEGRAAELLVDEQVVGLVAELPAELRRVAGLDDAVAWFVIELERLVHGARRPAPHQHVEPSRFQAVDRDFTFLGPESLGFAELAACARQAGKGLVRGVDLAQDVYRGSGVPEGHKALSLRVTLQADDRSLAEAEIAKTCERIVQSVENRTPARLRS